MSLLLDSRVHGTGWRLHPRKWDGGWIDLWFQICRRKLSAQARAWNVEHGKLWSRWNFFLVFSVDTPSLWHSISQSSPVCISQPNTNGSQFFICFSKEATGHLDGHHGESERTFLRVGICCSPVYLTLGSPCLVVFGSVISGLDVVNAMEQVGSDSGKTRVPVLIADSGQLR